jgi:hypothetical protein
VGAGRFLRQHEIVLRQAVDLVRPGRDLDFSLGKEEVPPEVRPNSGTNDRTPQTVLRMPFTFAERSINIPNRT